MYTILWEYSDPLIEKREVLKTFQWKSSNNLPNTLTETFWKIQTNVRMFTLIEILKMTKILGGLSGEEMSRFLYDSPGVLSDELFCAALRAARSGIEIEVLLKRLNFAQNLLQRQPWTLQSYWAQINHVKFRIIEFRKSIRKVKKYSGYIRTPSAKGSKSSHYLHHEFPETFEWQSYEELDWYEFLTVGKFLGISAEIQFPDDEPKSSKR